MGVDVIVKERFQKKYRHPTIDERLTKQRINGVRQRIRLWKFEKGRSQKIWPKRENVVFPCLTF